MTKTQTKKLRKIFRELAEREIHSLSYWAKEIGTNYHTVSRLLDDNFRTNTKTAFLLKRYLEKRNLLN